MTDPLYVTLLSPDDRGRFPLRRYLPHPEPKTWKVFRENGGRRIILEAVDE